MDDNSIIDLYFDRSEAAIKETEAKYGRYCFHIAENILNNFEDSEESVNDTYLAAWRTIPPKRPNRLAVYLGKMTRNISLDRWKHRNAAKRGGGEVPLVLEELEECVSGMESVESDYLQKEFTETINVLLETLPELDRKVFVCRYWYMDSVEEIAKRFDCSESKIASMLHRTRGKMRKLLEREGIA